MSFIIDFNNNFIKSTNNNDIISFKEIIDTFKINRKELINNLKINNITYNAFYQNEDDSIGCIYGYIKNNNINSNNNNNTTKNNNEEDINKIIKLPEQNTNYTQNIIYPQSVLKNIDEIIKYSPIMIQKYKNTLFKYDKLDILTSKQDKKYEMYKLYLSNTKAINKIEHSINKRLVPLTNIIFKLYKPLYNNYEDELNNIDFNNIKNDYYLCEYYNKYIILKNQHYKTPEINDTLNKIITYINNNYEQAIINKKLTEQQEILKTININISIDEINNPSLDILIQLIRYYDLCTDLFFIKECKNKSLLIYKLLIEVLYNFHKYNDLIKLYKKHNLPEDDYYFNILIKLNEKYGN